MNPKFLVWRVNQTLRARAERPKHRELEEWAEFQIRTKENERPKRLFV